MHKWLAIVLLYVFGAGIFASQPVLAASTVSVSEWKDYDIARYLYTQGEFIDEAYTKFLLGVLKKRNYPGLHSELASIYRKRGQGEMAKRHFDLELEAFPSSRVLVDKTIVSLTDLGAAEVNNAE